MKIALIKMNGKNTSKTKVLSQNKLLSGPDFTLTIKDDRVITLEKIPSLSIFIQYT